MVWPGLWSGHGREHILDPETDPLLGSSQLYPIIRSYACESQAFVLSSSGILIPNDFPEKWQYVRDSDHTNYSYAVGGSAIVNPHGRFIAGPLVREEAILYADCYASQIKLAKAIFDCLGHYTRWDIVNLQVRREPWTPEVKAVNKPPVKLPMRELQNISEEYEISMDKLQGIICKLNSLLST